MFDICKTVFSGRGSYVGIFEEPEHKGGGLWIRSLIRPEWGTTGKKKIATQMLKIMPYLDQRFVAFEKLFEPHVLQLIHGAGEIRLRIANSHTVLIDLNGLDIVFEHDYDELFASNFLFAENKFAAEYPICNTVIYIDLTDGSLVYDKALKRIFVSDCTRLTIRIKRTDLTYSDEKMLTEAEIWDSFLAFSSHFNTNEPQAMLAAYLLWSGTFSPIGNIMRECSPISKNKMNMVFLWANCFIGIAATVADEHLAKSNLLSITDYQKENGIILDAVNPVLQIGWFTKPPIYGYIYRIYESAGIVFSEKENRQLYDTYVRLADAWLANAGGNGLCSYNHPWDSGMDNATCFDETLPISTPDLNTYVVLLLDVIGDIADKLGMEREKAHYKKLSRDYCRSFIKQAWRDGAFAAITSDGTVIKIMTTCRYVPLLLGDHLPKKISSAMCKNMLHDGTLTEWSVASESVYSAKYDTRQGDSYKPGAYWRGPVWAYLVFIICHGLVINGNRMQAERIARRFIQLVEHNEGAIYEDYDALSGQGFDDSCNQWTAAIYLIAKSFCAKDG